MLRRFAVGNDGVIWRSGVGRRPITCTQQGRDGKGQRGCDETMGCCAKHGHGSRRGAAFSRATREHVRRRGEPLVHRFADLAQVPWSKETGPACNVDNRGKLSNGTHERRPSATRVVRGAIVATVLTEHDTDRPRSCALRHRHRSNLGRLTRPTRRHGYLRCRRRQRPPRHVSTIGGCPDGNSCRQSGGARGDPPSTPKLDGRPKRSRCACTGISVVRHTNRPGENTAMLPP